MAGDGTPSGFNSADFRTAIRFAMNMGTPTDPAKQVTFLFPEVDVFAPHDPAAHPYDWSSTPTAVTSPARQVTVLAAVSYGGPPLVEGTPMGQFDQEKLTLTLLDQDYALVVGATEVLVGGVHYVIDPPGAMPVGLFDVTVYTLHATARG
jgi:hypothetical protein